MICSVQDDQRIVITGLGLTAPNGDTLADFREALLSGKSGVDRYNIRSREEKERASELLRSHVENARGESLEKLWSADEVFK